jgi:hypothetical protein
LGLTKNDTKTHPLTVREETPHMATETVLKIDNDGFVKQKWKAHEGSIDMDPPQDDYDYSQHMRPIGVTPGAIFISKPFGT